MGRPVCRAAVFTQTYSAAAVATIRSAPTPRPRTHALSARRPRSNARFDPFTTAAYRSGSGSAIVGAPQAKAFPMTRRTPMN